MPTQLEVEIAPGWQEGDLTMQYVQQDASGNWQQTATGATGAVTLHVVDGRQVARDSLELDPADAGNSTVAGQGRVQVVSGSLNIVGWRDHQIAADGSYVPPQTNAELDQKLDGIDGKLDLTAREATLDAQTTTLLTRFDTVDASLVIIDGKLDLTAQEATLDAQTTTLLTRFDTVDAAIADVKTSADEIFYVHRADSPLGRGETARWTNTVVSKFVIDVTQTKIIP